MRTHASQPWKYYKPHKFNFTTWVDTKHKYIQTWDIYYIGASVAIYVMSGIDMPEYHIFTLYYNNDDILISIILFDFMDKENGRSTFDTNMIQCLNPAL